MATTRGSRNNRTQGYPSKVPSSIDFKQIVVGVLVLVAGYWCLTYGAAYFEYVQIWRALQSTADSCMTTFQDNGAERARCSAQARHAVVAILGQEDPQLSVDTSQEEHTGKLLILCEYVRVVKLVGLGSQRTLHFSLTGSAAQPDRGFNANPK